MGKNKEFLFQHLPHIDQILSNSLPNLLNENEIIVITQKVGSENLPLFRNIRNKIIDLVRIKELEDLDGYEGISW